jgi:hypothetical protein
MSDTASTWSFFNCLSGWIIFSCLFILSSCSDKPRKDFNLTIVVSDALGDNEDAPLPDEIIRLCMPLKACEKHNLVPKPVLHRLGFGPDEELSLETKIEGGFAGNENNVKLITREINSHLTSLKVGETFSRPAPNVDLQASLQEFKSSMAVNTIPVYFSSRGTAYSTEDGDRIYSSIDSVRMAIVNQLCQSSGYRVVVFYELSLVNEHEEPEDETFVNNDRVLDELHDKNIGAKGHEEDLEEVAREIKEKDDPDDYRFTYELVKNRIYGKHHHEAFELLAKAAEIAIDNGQALYLLDRIEDEKDKDLWKLSHGHASQWHPIVEALENNN